MISPWNSFKLNLININLPRLPVHYPHFSSSISSMEFSLKCHSMYAYGDDWIINNYLISISISSWASALRTCIISLWKFLVVCRWRRWWCELQYIYLLILRLYRNARLTRLHNKLIFFFAFWMKGSTTHNEILLVSITKISFSQTWKCHWNFLYNFFFQLQFHTF